MAEYIESWLSAIARILICEWYVPLNLSMIANIVTKVP